MNMHKLVLPTLSQLSFILLRQMTCFVFRYVNGT